MKWKERGSKKQREVYKEREREIGEMWKEREEKFKEKDRRNVESER